MNASLVNEVADDPVGREGGPGNVRHRLHLQLLQNLRLCRLEEKKRFRVVDHGLYLCERKGELD